MPPIWAASRFVHRGLDCILNPGFLRERLMFHDTSMFIASAVEDDWPAIDVGSVGIFAVQEHYQVNTESEVPIKHLDREFVDSLYGVVENDVPDAVLRRRKLVQPPERQAVPGRADEGRVKEIIAFAHVFQYLKSAERNRWHNFLVIDALGRIWRLIVFWHYHGWWIKSRQSDEPNQRWYPGERLIAYA